MDYSGKIITKNPVEPSQTSAPGVWTLDQATQAVQGNNWPIAYVPNPISRSLRFNSADSTKLTRTPASAGNRKTWTFSAWIKRSALSSTQGIFHCYDGSSSRRASIQFNSDNTIGWDQGGDGSSGLIDTVAVYRDVSAWYHLVCVADYSNGTAANRAKIYINNVLQTVTTTDDFENADGLINSTNQHQIGSVDTVSYFNGYLTEINFIDGQALDPTYFGMTDPRTGAWIPKKYSGTYGTNGFYLNFSDNSSTAALGTDYSGNSNTWTTNNFSVTTDSDSMTDVPTPWIPYNTTGDVGGVVRGNYATLNPLLVSTASFANGNLDGTLASGTASAVFAGTVSIPTTGKYYFEYTVNTASGDVHAVGIVQTSLLTKGTMSNDSNAEYATAIIYRSNGVIYKNTSSQGTYTAISNGDIIGVAVDVAAGTCGLYRNGSLILSVTSITSTDYSPFACKNPTGGSYSASFVFNAGQRPFAYTPPAGFKSLCTTNLPEPTILDGGDYFNAVLWTGNSSARTITGVGFDPDFVWIKDRSTAYSHVLFDRLRGAGNYLISNGTLAETTDTNYMSAFATDGFSVGTSAVTNGSTESSVGWNWKAGGTGVSNTAGTIPSTVSANTTAGFSVVTYTGTGGSGTTTVGHGLSNVAPAMVIIKNRSSATAWPVYHKSLTSTSYYIELNTTSAQQNYGSTYISPGSTTLTIAADSSLLNTSSSNYVAYCFAPVEGYSAFGSYTGNGSSDGPFVYTGFRPRWVMIKRVDAGDTTNWFVFDTERADYNLVLLELYANLSNAEGSDGKLDILSNGFKIRTSGSGANSSSINYIYAAFAENPFKYSNAR